MSNEVFKAVGRVNQLSVLTIDAYGVAVKNGFQGTVEEWLESLRGKDATDEQIIAALEKYMNEHGSGNVDLTGYATEQWVNDQNYLTEVPNGYAKIEDIPSLGGYAKTEDVPTDAEIIQLINDNAPKPSGGGIAVTGAKVGQTVKIAEVDENGVPTAWEPMDVSYTKSEIDAIMGSYVTDIDTLVGGDG